MTLWDAPNQQVVRADQSGPWEEGTGGEPGELSASTVEETTADSTDLASMTKAELLEYAKQHDVSPANNDMTKAELIEAIEAG